MKILWQIAVLLGCGSLVAQTRPPISLDEFLNTTEIRDAKLSPSGDAAVVSVSAPNWKQERFDENLWLWTAKAGTPRPLTLSGHDSSPEWSPDGKYIAFVSDRPLAGDDDKDQPGRVWVMPVAGGEAFPLYTDNLDTHTFAWSEDSAAIYFSVKEPLTAAEKEQQKKEWKDVIRWREQERGDVLLSLPVGLAEERSTHPAVPHPPADKSDVPLGAATLMHSKLEIDALVPSPDGSQIAMETGPPTHRVEDPADTELFVAPAKGGEARRLTHNQGLEEHLAWSRDGRQIYFLTPAAGGSVEGPYRDVQGRLYSLDAGSGKITRLGGEFQGSWEDFVLTSDGTLLATGLAGIDQGVYRVDGAGFKAAGLPTGRYGHLSAARSGTAILFTHSTINDPTQVFVAAGVDGLAQAKAVTAFNPIFGERAQVEWEPYRWKSDDGTPVEGVLIYPPGKKGAKNLRMLTLIHGGPADADGDRFGADWYSWATLAAAHGWLVFQPNYRGSSGYGDAFMLAIEPHLVSAPGKDILAGVDALVKDGIADPDKLAIGGYSYGGYMTNWLITQTTRFKAAVTGAGAVEHAANWGNDDLTWDDAWYLSGAPWEKPELYQSEAALFQMNKVTTPTHIVGGAVDVRVSWFEQTTLERALQRLGVPHALLLFPGENHPLNKNPWHGYIKVREELKWLDKYVPQ
jgi:dipeptidyl aminopeptidase/acylaminoacyl peptidase